MSEWSSEWSNALALEQIGKFAIQINLLREEIKELNIKEEKSKNSKRLKIGISKDCCKSWVSTYLSGWLLETRKEIEELKKQCLERHDFLYEYLVIHNKKLGQLDSLNKEVEDASCE